MTEATFKNAVDEMLGRLDPIVRVIQQGGGEAALYSLQQRLCREFWMRPERGLFYPKALRS
jgi:hypothetical protein